MKTFFWIFLILCAGWLWDGCACGPAHPAAAQAKVNPATEAVMLGEAGNESEEEWAAEPASKGTPEGLAHWAAGLSYLANGDEERALQQFEAAVLADPSNETLAVRLSRALLREHHPKRAITILSSVAAQPNASGEIFSWLARAYFADGKTNESLRTSRLAINRAPKSLGGYASLVEVLLQTGRSSEALKALDEAARNVRSEAPTLVSLAQLYIYLENARFSLNAADTKLVSHRAETLLDLAAKKNFNSLELWQRLADSYARIGRPKKAADIYAKLIASAAPSAVVNQLRGELANLYLQLQDHTNAVKQLQAIVRENPERYPRAWYALGRLAYEDGKLSDAADDFENALHGDPTLESAYFELALVQADLHRTGEALHTVDRAHNFFANNFEGEFVTALVYSHTQNYAEAVRHFTAAEVIGLASKSNRLDQRFYFPFGAACERNGQFDQAAQYLQKCIDLSPDFSEALNYLGYMWADRGQNLAKARDLIEKAVKLDPKNGAYLDSLGWVLFKQKQPAQALPWLLKAMQYSTKPDPTVLDHLGEVYMALGQPDKAREAWKKSLLLESNEQIKKKLEASSAPAS